MDSLETASTPLLMGISLGVSGSLVPLLHYSANALGKTSQLGAFPIWPGDMEFSISGRWAMCVTRGLLPIFSQEGTSLARVSRRRNHP